MLAFSIDYYGVLFRATQSVGLFCTYEREYCCMRKQLKVSTGGTEKFDILKFILSLLVVVRHGAQYIFKDGTDCIVYHTVVSGLSSIAVPTFFGITGYFSYESSREKSDVAD